VQNYCKLTYNSFAHIIYFILPTFIVQNYGMLTYIFSFRMLSAAALCSQADLRFLGAGNQCVTNSYQAMVFALKKSPANWSTVDLNSILDKSDTLYSDVDISGHLLITDIPKTHENIKMNIISANSGSLYDGKVDKPYIWWWFCSSNQTQNNKWSNGILECLGERLSSKRNCVPFEVTNVLLSDILNNSIQCSSSSDFEGFSEISDT